MTTTYRPSPCWQRPRLANAYRATLGFPPLELNRKAKTVSVKTSGQMLTNRPEILREWDPENTRDPWERSRAPARAAAARRLRETRTSYDAGW